MFEVQDHQGGGDDPADRVGAGRTSEVHTRPAVRCGHDPDVAAVMVADQAARIVVPTDELKSWAWSDTSGANRRLPTPLARRITEALHARTDGSTRYLEDGVRVT